MTLIRYVDGPWEGTTVETDALTIDGTHDHGEGTVQAVRYLVDRVNYTAHFAGWGDRWDKATGVGAITPDGRFVADLEHAVPEEPLLSEATDDQIRAELTRRGYRPRLSTPMRRRRRDIPRAGFGQRWPSD